MGNVIISNIVNKDTLRLVQKNTLNEIASYLKTSFGPFGSNSIIKRDKTAATEYTKDGHDILSQIKYSGPIETSIVDDLIDITKYVVKTVGDGTTSAVEMSNFIFEGLMSLENEKNYKAYDIIFAFKKVVDEMIEKIKKNGRECTLDDIYDIAFTSTNGNEKLAKNLYQLYKEYGFDIYIDLQVALSSEQDIIKVYDGMTLEDGYTDSVYANKDNGVCEIVNPNIYVFQDPVDTPEMINLFDRIVFENIYKAYSSKNEKKNIEPVPTVIIVPMISVDMSAFINELAKFMMNFPIAQKPPFAIIKAYMHQDAMADIAMMCGAPMIKKYINDDIHQNDINKGLAPSLDNVHKFCGSCEMISITKDNTKVIRPAKMFNEDGTHSEAYNNLLGWCEAELERAKAENQNSVTIYNLKKRINSLKANLIEYFVGGISISDRDNDRALLEDAIKNCRSAIANGVGYGANVEGLKVIAEMNNPSNTIEVSDLERLIRFIIYDAYRRIICLLYPSVARFNQPGEYSDKQIEFFENCIDHGPLNLRTNEFDGKVKSSIMSDAVIIEAISRIITRMATAEQFILPDPMYNVYGQYTEDHVMLEY